MQSLDEIGRYLDLDEGNRFRANAYRRAARALEAFETDPTDLVANDALLTVPGVGKGIAPIIKELVETRRSPYLEELRSQYPVGIFDLLRVPNLGLKKILTLHEALGVATLQDLQEACREKKIRGLRGFGAKTEETICAGLANLSEAPVRWLLPKALGVAQMLRDLLLEREISERVEISGAIRRRLETVDAIVLCVESVKAAKTIKAIEALDVVADATHEGHVLRGAVRGIPTEIHVIAAERFGAALLLTTGSEKFVESLLTAATKRKENLAELEAGDEKPLFAAAGVAYVEPELREGEVSLKTAATWSRKLVELRDLRGVFHVHTTWSDGGDTLQDMLAAAVERDFDYVGISDHSKTAGYAGGLTEQRVAQQQREIETMRREHPSLRIFRGSEVDILAAGELDYDTKTLSTFDFTVASVHSRFKMERDEMTERIVNALRNPFTTFLGHMTGRKLLTRPGYQLDVDPVFDAAAENGVMIEINANPNRLDIDWRLMRKALDRGVVFCINPDAHSTSEYDHLLTGIWNARKGGLEACHIFNTLDVEQVAEYLAARRERAIRLTK